MATGTTSNIHILQAMKKNSPVISILKDLKAAVVDDLEEWDAMLKRGGHDKSYLGSVRKGYEKQITALTMAIGALEAEE